MASYSTIVLQHWYDYQGHVTGENVPPANDGSGITLGYLVAVARNGAHVTSLKQAASARLDHSHAALQRSLLEGEVIYGVNTGFGGSATTRTQKVDQLQQALLRECNNGVLPRREGHIPTYDGTLSTSSQPNGVHRDETPSAVRLLRNGLPSQDLIAINHMPPSWVRATLLVRISSLVSGVSGVRSIIVQQMISLLQHDIVPLIPMHGSISASGDLQPLSYVASALQGKANSVCTIGALSGSAETISAKNAMLRVGMTPQRVVAKEALAIINGTAVSAGVAALAMHEAHGLVTISQILTAMSVESLRGSDESFDPLFAEVRPHPGQIESSRNILAFLRNSKLINRRSTSSSGFLYQDRYSIRTAAQWLSPVLEDILLAHKQIEIECNSVTDNPLIEALKDKTRHLHGGNFQARAITSAMEKVRSSIQTVGRMLFTQATEIINPRTNQGLAPNLVVDEPSESYLFKCLDIMIAALASEMGFLTGNVGSHVQTAEMGNQALNSLALISARYTLTAIDLLAKLVSVHLLVVCQALDLRVMNERFFEAVKPKVRVLAAEWFGNLAEGPVPEHAFTAQVEAALFDGKTFDDTTEMDSSERFNHIADFLPSILMATTPSQMSSISVGVLQDWTTKLAATLYSTWHDTRNAYINTPDASPYLGNASRSMYEYVRWQLKIPLLRTDVLVGEDGDDEEGVPTVGAHVTRIYEAVRSGEIMIPVIHSLEAVIDKQTNGHCR